MSRAPSTHSTTHGWPTNTQTQRDREARAAAAAATAVAATLPTTPCLCTSILLWHCAIKIVPISYTLYNHSDGQKASEWKHMGPAQADSSADSSDLPFLSKLTSSAVGMLVCKCLVDVGKTGKKRKKKSGIRTLHKTQGGALGTVLSLVAVVGSVGFDVDQGAVVCDVLVKACAGASHETRNAIHTPF